MDHLIEWRGRTLSITEWSRFLGLNRSTLSHRLRRGWTVERALEHFPRRYTADHRALLARHGRRLARLDRDQHG